MEADFKPQPEQQSYDYTDTDESRPPINVYIEDVVKVRQVASDRLSMYTTVLTVGATEATRIVGKAENGVASKVTLMALSTVANQMVAVFNGKENLGVATLVGLPDSAAHGFQFPLNVPVSVTTADDLYAVALNGAGSLLLSVMIEQYYGN